MVKNNYMKKRKKINSEGEFIVKLEELNRKMGEFAEKIKKMTNESRKICSERNKKSEKIDFAEMLRQAKEKKLKK